MSDAEKTFGEMRTMQEALQVAMQVAENRVFVNNTHANHAAATFMGAAQWLLVQLAYAAVNDELLERLVDLQLEFNVIFDHLDQSPRHGH